MSLSLSRSIYVYPAWTNENGNSFTSSGSDVRIGGEITVTEPVYLTSIGWSSPVLNPTFPVQIGLFDTTTKARMAFGYITPAVSTFGFDPILLIPGISYDFVALVPNGELYFDSKVPLPFIGDLAGKVIVGNGAFDTTSSMDVPPPGSTLGTSWRGNFVLTFRSTSTQISSIPWEPSVEPAEGSFTIQLPIEWLPTTWTEWDLQYSTAIDNSTWGDWKDLETTQYPATAFTMTDLNVNEPPFYRFRYRLHTQSNKTLWSEPGQGGIAINVVKAEDIQGQIDGTGQVIPGSVTGGSIAAGTITGSLISAGTITAGNIQANTITATQIAANTITAAQIAAHTITAGEIAAGVITATEIKAGTITATQIAADTITSNEIKANTIQAIDIKAGTITGTEIAANTITATNIAANTITAGQITAGTITTTEIKANTITAANIKAATITSTEIAANTIKATNILAATITSTEIAATTIKGTNIAAHTITSGEIAAGTITTGEIAAGTITGGNVAAGTITASNITVSTLSSLSADIGTVTAGQLRIGTAGGVKVAIGQAISTSVGSKDGIVGTDSSNNITFFVNATTGDLQLKGQILSGSSGLGNITGLIDGKANITSGTITGDRLVANTITAGQIAAGTVTATEIAASTITGAKIAATTITATNLNVSTLSAISADLGTITAGTVTGATFRTASANPKVVLDSTGLSSIDSGGVTTVSLTGAGGLNLELGTTSTPPDNRSIIWGSSGTQYVKLNAWKTGGSAVLSQSVVSYNKTDSTLLNIASSHDFSKAVSGVQLQASDALGAAFVLAGNGGIAETRMLLDGAGQSQFIQYDPLGTAAKISDYGLVTGLPVTGLTAGSRCILEIDPTNGIFWWLIYDGVGSYPWKKVGGPPLQKEILTQQSTSSASFVDLTTSGPSISVPIGGDYQVEMLANTQTQSGFAAIFGASYNSGAAADDAIVYGTGGTIEAPGIGKAFFTGCVATKTIRMRYRVDNASNTGYFKNRKIYIDPVRIG